MAMSVEKVREYLMPYGVADRMREFEVSSATVELAALAVGVEGARIAKTLSFKVGEDPILIVAAGESSVIDMVHCYHNIEEQPQYNGQF